MIVLLLSILSFSIEEPRIVFLNTERTEYKFRWESASGPVVAYEACIEYENSNWRPEHSRICERVQSNEHVFIPDWWIAWRIQVRAVDVEGNTGDWSEPSLVFNVNPNIGDVNYDGGIGVPDFTIIFNEWGKVAN